MTRGSAAKLMVTARPPPHGADPASHLSVAPPFFPRGVRLKTPRPSTAVNDTNDSGRFFAVRVQKGGDARPRDDGNSPL
ncbi:hypothetical protein E2C01_043214 [Portunus trituberculatus]|uniref:Uncharacterized protein n=1 Tax=Portunus trituberculatus TaxID=210409 RepID=A0A5B7FVQ0_PORTR|nr:hypothetical protein [Portunus trituberculatus]